MTLHSGNRDETTTGVSNSMIFEYQASAVCSLPAAEKRLSKNRK